MSQTARVSEQLLVTADGSAAQTFQMETLMKSLGHVLGSTAAVACVLYCVCVCVSGQIIRCPAICLNPLEMVRPEVCRAARYTNKYSNNHSCFLEAGLFKCLKVALA